MFRNILLAYDHSTHAQRALAEGIDIAQSAGGRLTVMTVVAEPYAWLAGGGAVVPYYDTDLMRRVEEEAQETLDAAVARAPDDLPITKVLVGGAPGPKIVEQAAAGKHDLVIVGSRGRGNVRSLLLGSVSHHVLHGSQVPVLVVRADEDAQPVNGELLTTAAPSG